MAYGSGQRLGQTINPQFMQVDFSPYERAGATMGNAFANAGKQIGDSIKEYNTNEKEIKKAIEISKSIKNGIPGLSPMADEALSQLNNPELSQRDRLAVAESIKDSLNIGMTGLQEQRAQEEFNMRKAAAGAAASARRSADADKIIEAQNIMKAFPSQIAILEASGFGPQAQAYKDQYDKAMAAGDINTAMTLAGTVSGFTGAMKPSTLQPVQPTASPQELASSVKDALEIGVTNAVDVQPNLVQLFNDSLKSGDSKRAAKIATNITNTVNTQVETQQKESKDIVKLQDGSEVLLGKTTGTRFTPDGKAIPRTSPIYTQPIAERETTIEEKITKLGEAKELYEKGDKQGALNIMNAIGTGGLFGKTITMEELDSQMQGQTNQEPNSKTREEIKQKLFPKQ
jgi:hypothetical protein